MTITNDFRTASSFGAKPLRSLADNTVASVKFMTVLVGVYSFGNVFRYTPEVGWIFIYGTILSIWAGLYLFIVTNAERSAIHKTDFVFLAVFCLMIPYTYWLGNQASEIAGDAIRVMIILGSLIYWTRRKIDLELFLALLSRRLFSLCIVVLLVKVIGERTLFGREIDVDLPVLVLTFCLTLWHREWFRMVVTIGMIVLTGKEAGGIAVFAVLGVYFYKRNASGALFVIGVAVLLLLSREVIFTLMTQSSVSKIMRIGELGLMLSSRVLDDTLLNLVTTNRWSEYQSLFDVWREQGMPVLGYGLGAELNIYIFHREEYALRSTFHNSLFAIYHKAGIFGLMFILIYILRMFVRPRGSEFFIYAATGLMFYCLFNYSLWQSPSFLMMIGLYHRGQFAGGARRT